MTQKNDILLFNTLNKNKEVFESITENKVSMYSCGPTVYNYAHIGNLRAYIMSDLIRRVLKNNGYEVFQVMNLTDIGHLTSDADSGEDKMMKGLLRENLPVSIDSLKILGHKYFESFKEDIKKMNIIFPEKFIFATDEIEEQIKLNQKLLDDGFAYKTNDGLYFDTSKISDYGLLGGGIANTEHSRIGTNDQKRNPEDFALWKFESGNGIGFEAPFGRGFPGWHIECTAISQKYLGQQFDIHTGGVDHVMVHHNNEIAQGEALTGKVPAHFWIHNEHITIGEEKMAKSGEFLSLDVLTQKGVSPLAYRYWLLTGRYSTRMDYSIEAVLSAQTAYNKIIIFLSDIDKLGSIIEEYKSKFITIINDDLDTPKALGLLWEVLRSESLSKEDRKATILYFDEFLGLDLKNTKKEIFEIPQEVKALNLERNIAREKRDWNQADNLRHKIRELGFEIKDTEDGSEFEKLTP